VTREEFAAMEAEYLRQEFLAQTDEERKAALLVRIRNQYHAIERRIFPWNYIVG
jgi:hypothetical protein